ncbi:hypothetical protein [Palleronia marisminoris]|uniref:hypothetical protein n=1 Tax=Palleronia marisminoris TaxID=315423 RepID=UPI0011146156|nr:hypothetical protein [Palleronia marisminoris]
MTMFSMKPKFDLAEFLAVPAPKGAARTGGARRRGTQFQPSAASKAASKPAGAAVVSPSDKA